MIFQKWIHYITHKPSIWLVIIILFRPFLNMHMWASCALFIVVFAFFIHWLFVNAD